MRAGLVLGVSLLLNSGAQAAPFDAAPFGLPLPEGNGLMWEDPREIHRVVVHFKSAPPAPDKVRLDYWGSRWPEQHLPKDREPGGGDVGWMELGNWWSYGWRKADAEARTDGNAVSFTFRPVNAKEFPKVKDYPAAFRYTLKIRVASESALPAIEKIETFTDSSLEERSFRLVNERTPLGAPASVFNGGLAGQTPDGRLSLRCRVQAVVNPDPNTFDRTLVTVRKGREVFTFRFDDLTQGPLFLPHLGVAVLPDDDTRDYAAVAAEQKARGAKTLYDRVAEMPEQTWRAAWDGMPPKKSHIYFPLGLDGGRQRFRLNADGSLDWRSNDHYLMNRPGKDTPRLALEKAGASLRFGLPSKPVHRTLEEEACRSATRYGTERGARTADGLRDGTGGRHGPGPRLADRLRPTRRCFHRVPGAIHLHQHHRRTEARVAAAQLQSRRAAAGLARGRRLALAGRALRGAVAADSPPETSANQLEWKLSLAPPASARGHAQDPLRRADRSREQEALPKLDFETERKAMAGYWRRRLDESAQPDHAGADAQRVLPRARHAPAGELRAANPKSDRRFARVGSFGYGAYGNESCMMVVDLDRRGYHKEAQDCLDAWLHYQGTVGAAGEFLDEGGRALRGGRLRSGRLQPASRLDSLDAGRALPVHAGRGVAAARGAGHRGGRGLDHPRDGAHRRTATSWSAACCPPGASRTSATGGRGFPPVATRGAGWTPPPGRWSRSSIPRPAASGRRPMPITQALLANFRKASDRSPVVRLRDGTAVPAHSRRMVHRRGRYFGWICETLEGSIHLLITGALDPHSPEAGLDSQGLRGQPLPLEPIRLHCWTISTNTGSAAAACRMQACLLLDVEPYLYRDDVKHALRALFNAQAVQLFPGRAHEHRARAARHGRLARRPLQELRRIQLRRLAALPVRARGE